VTRAPLRAVTHGKSRLSLPDVSQGEGTAGRVADQCTRPRLRHGPTMTTQSMSRPVPLSDPALQDQEQRRAPARKDTRTWCKGKVGRPHTPQVVLIPWAVSMGLSCSPGDYAPSGWNCLHRVSCSTCGKIQSQFLGSACPDRQGAARLP
jgi:hypothetical protein